MQKARVILSLIFILGCVSADYKTLGSWAVAPKKVANSDSASDSVFFPYNQLGSQVQSGGSVKLFLIGANTTDKTTTVYVVRNLTVPAFTTVGNDSKLTIPTNAPVMMNEDSNSFTMINTTSDNKIVASYLNLNGGAPAQIATVDSGVKAPATLLIESVVNQNGTIVVLYSDGGANLNFSILTSGKQTTAVLATNYTKGSAQCVPHNDGKNVYCYLKTSKDKTVTLQYVSIDSSASKAGNFSSIDGDATNYSQIHVFSTKDQNGIVFKNSSNFTYFDENKKNVTVGAALSTDASLELNFVTHHKGSVAVFFDWTSNNNKNVGYQIITKDGKIESTNNIIQEASSVSLSKATDGSLFVVTVNGKDANIGQVWGKSSLALKTAFSAIFAAFVAIFLF